MIGGTASNNEGLSICRYTYEEQSDDRIANKTTSRELDLFRDLAVWKCKSSVDVSEWPWQLLSKSLSKQKPESERERITDATNSRENDHDDELEPLWSCNNSTCAKVNHLYFVIWATSFSNSSKYGAELWIKPVPYNTLILASGILQMSVRLFSHSPGYNTVVSRTHMANLGSGFVFEWTPTWFNFCIYRPEGLQLVYCSAQAM